MDFRLISLVPSPPEGFEYVTSLTRRDLLIRPFALFAEDIQSAEECLSPFGASISGIVVTNGDERIWSQISPTLFHLVIPVERFGELRYMLDFQLALIDKCRSSEDANLVLEQNLSRAKKDSLRNVSEFQRTKNNLLDELSERKRAESALVESEERFRTLMEEIPGVAVQGYALDGTVRFWNRASEDLYGYSADEALGGNLLDLIIPEPMRADVSIAVQHMKETKVPVPASELNLKRKDGTLVPVYSSHAIVTPIGRAPELFCLDVDLTEQKAAEKQLAYSTSLTNAALESTADGILVVDRNGRIARWNQKFVDLWRVPHELLVTDVPDPVLAYVLTQVSNPEGFLARVQELYNHPEESSQDMIELDDGRVFDRYSQPLKIGYEIVGRFWSFRDITELITAKKAILRDNEFLERCVIERTRSLEELNSELLQTNLELDQKRKESEAAQRKMQQLTSAVENSPTAIVITDYNGNIEYVNPRFTSITGYLPGEVTGQNPRILKADGMPASLYVELWETITSGKLWSGDLYNRKKNGEVFWEHASISPIRNETGAITHFVAIKEDVTEQKRLAKELLDAQQTAQDASRLKSEFLANMSHEIRTPLSAIIGFASLLLKTSPEPQQYDYIQKIKTSGELLLYIINEILDFSKIEAQHLQIEEIPFRLDIMLENVAGMLQQKAVEKGIALHLKVYPDVMTFLVGDQQRLSQIVVNLLSNAVKFTETGGVALDVVQLIRLRNRVKLRFSVQDTGIGISDSQLSRLFQPFTQADGSTTRRFGGTGLGLSISRRLVEMMGGEIWCESIPGEGSTFSFTVWLGIDEALEKYSVGQSISDGLPEAAIRSDFSGIRILLAEDNKINQSFIIELFKDTEATLVFAENGQEAVDLIVSDGSCYDIVLMDIQMPVLDGYDAIQRIRRDSRFSSLPIIAVTAHAMKDEQQRIRQAGADFIITKPIIADKLFQAVNGALGIRKKNFADELNQGGAGGPPVSFSHMHDYGVGEPVDLASVAPLLCSLLGLINGWDGRAESFLYDFRSELSVIPLHETEKIARYLKAYNFAAAREALLELARNHGISLNIEEEKVP